MDQQKATEWLEKMASKHGFTDAGGGSASEVRPSEVISGSSGVQFSYGENSYQAVAEGGDFGDRSRENARENDHSKVFSGYADGSNPMQSPDLGSDGFTLRYGIGFLCWDYKKWSDLKDIRDNLASPTNAYKKAFKGMGKSHQYVNPTAADIRKKISDWVAVLERDLRGQGTGELVISFQGHGDQGNVYGVDEKPVSPADMLSLAKAAEKKKISLTYILDACFSGNAIAAFATHAAEAVDRKIDAAEGLGQVCSEENTQRAEALRDQMAHARELTLFCEALGRHGKTLFRLVSTIEAKNDIPSWDAAIQHNQLIIRETEQMLNQFKVNFDFGNRPGMDLKAMSQAMSTLITTLQGIRPNTCFDYTRWTGSIGKCQDSISNGANKIIELINADLKALGI